MNKDDEKKASDRLLALVEAYGTNPDRWPEAERRRRNELDAGSSDGQARLAKQRRLDELLDGAKDLVVSRALLRKVAEIPLRHPPASSWKDWPLARLRNALALGAAVGALGMMVGVTISDPGAPEDAAGQWDELSSLAFGVDFTDEALP